MLPRTPPLPTRGAAGRDDAYMPCALCAPILELDMSDRSLFETYERELGYRLHRGTRAIERVRRVREIAEHLGVREGAPVLAFSGVTYIEDGRAIEYFVGVHRGDRSRFETELFRPSAQAEARAHAQSTSRRDRARPDRLGVARHRAHRRRGNPQDEGARVRHVRRLRRSACDLARRAQAIKDTCAEVGLPVRSAVCIALGLVDFVPPCGVSRSTGAGPTSTSRCSSAAATCCS